jgi:hypothetical protein
MYLDGGFWFTNHRHYSFKSLERLLSRYNFEISEVFERGGIFTAFEILIHGFQSYVFHSIFKTFGMKPKVPKVFYKKIKREYSLNKNHGFTLFVTAKKVNC